MSNDIDSSKHKIKSLDCIYQLHAYFEQVSFAIIQGAFGKV